MLAWGSLPGKKVNGSVGLPEKFRRARTVLVSATPYDAELHMIQAASRGALVSPPQLLWGLLSLGVYTVEMGGSMKGSGRYSTTPGLLGHKDEGMFGSR